MEKVRWGIVSAGTIANTFAADMVHVSNAEICAVAARSQDSAESFADKYGIGKAYQGYENLFSDPDIDAVYVGTPHTLHFKNAADALQAGKAVLCEKPLTTSAKECETLLAVARDTDSYLMEAMWTWFLPAVSMAKKWLDAGRIGKLRHIMAELGYPKPYDPDSRLYDPALAGGCLLDMGIYPVAIARYFSQQAPTDIKVISRHAPNGVDDDIAMLFNYPSLVATLATSFRCKLPNTAYIVGTEGFITIPHCWSARECQLFVMHEQVDQFVDQRRGSGLEFQIESVSADILEGRKESGVVTHAASLAFQQDMDRIKALFSTRLGS